ncbi:MAG: hypothetical protein J7605_04870 [Variovorax sp.]|nr:hypothetical protein [Variovorax sp.]
MAYTLFRTAELANEEGKPAFLVIEGAFNPQMLDGADNFSRSDDIDFRPEDFAVSHPGRGDGGADIVIGQEPLPTLRTRGAAGVPITIYVPSAPVALPRTSLLVRLLPVVPDEANDRVFVTQQVLDQLGPRIRPAKTAGE